MFYLALYNICTIFSLIICHHFLNTYHVFNQVNWYRFFSFNPPNGPVKGLSLFQYYRWSSVKLGDLAWDDTGLPDIQAPLEFGSCVCVWTSDVAFYVLSRPLSYFSHDGGDWYSTDIFWINESSFSHQTLLTRHQQCLCVIASKVHAMDFFPLDKDITFIFAELIMEDEGKHHSFVTYLLCMV